MNKLLHRTLYSLIVFLLFIVPTLSMGQSSSTFDIEVGSSYSSISKLFTLSGNRVGVLINSETGTSTYLNIYNSSGTQTANIDITSQINWTHTSHGAVTLNAVQMNNGNIFIAYSANSNFTGIQSYNGRYTIINESGVQQSTGQLNTTDAAGSYTWGILLDKLSDGKIVAVWRRITGDNLTFRLFNTDGTPAGNDVAFSGVGTSNSFLSTYTYKLAAGKNGNFMVSAYFWNGAFRGFAFTNDGANAVSGEAANFMVDATNNNNYSNIGLVALPNGNFAACWWLAGTFYIKTMAPDGTAIVDKQAIAAGSYTDMIPSNDVGSEGFILAESRPQDPMDMGSPYAALFINRYNQAGILQSSTISDDGFLIQPTFYAVAGASGGLLYAYSFYKSFEIDIMMGMAMVTSDNDIKGRMVGFQMGTLPVSLLSFDATLLSNNTARLSWKTASESANSHFEIEKSIDGRNFLVIGKVLANRSGGGGSDYSFIDPATVTGTTFYRLKQFDTDGRMKDLGTKVIHTTDGNVPASVYPNPAQGSKITLSAGSQSLPAIYRLSDIQGRVLRSGTMQQSQEEINIQDLNEGIYFLQIGKQVIKLRR